MEEINEQIIDRFLKSMAFDAKIKNIEKSEEGFVLAHLTINRPKLFTAQFGKYWALCINGLHCELLRFNERDEDWSTFTNYSIKWELWLRDYHYNIYRSAKLCSIENKIDSLNNKVWNIDKKLSNLNSQIDDLVKERQKIFDKIKNEEQFKKILLESSADESSIE